MISDPLVEAAARLFHTTARDIRGKSGFTEHVAARRAVCYVMRARWGARYASIGRAVGYADHTTAMYSTRMGAERAKADPDYLTKVIALARVPVPGGRGLRTHCIGSLSGLWMPKEIAVLADWKKVHPAVDTEHDPWQAGAYRREPTGIST